MLKPTLTFYTNMPTPYQLDFFEALQQLFDLHVIYFSTRESDRSWTLDASNVNYRTTTLKNGWLIRQIQKKVVSFHFSLAIIRQIFKQRPQFVIVNGTYWSPNVIIAIILNKLRKSKVFFWSEPLFPTSSRFKYRLKRILFFPVRRFTDVVFAIGQSAEKSVREYGYKRPVYLLPYNINVNLFSETSMSVEKIADLRLTFKSKNEIIFLASGSLIHRKGMDILVDAMSRITRSDIRLLIIGSGPEKETLKLLAGSDHRIIFLGFREKEEIPYWFSLADVFITASRYDGWALVVNEALAAGLPIIASDQVGAARDLLRDNVDSFICGSGNSDQFAAAMIRMIESPDKRAVFAQNARARATEVSSEYNADKLFNILAKL
jgi:glycosyltransferase involved in cell wall biosynthesis